MKVRRQKGFSLLEAIVALTILASSGVALFSWFSVTYDGLIRLQEVQARHQLMDDLHAYFSTLNIQEETTQRMRVNGFDVTWKAELLEPKQTGRGLTGGLSNFDLGLYDVDIEIGIEKRIVGRYQTRLVGYRRVRILNNEPG